MTPEILSGTGKHYREFLYFCCRLSGLLFIKTTTRCLL